MARRRRRTIIPANKRAIAPRAYRSLWRVVDGAVRDCLNQHPEYLTDRGRRAMQASMTKRIAGAVFGFASASARARAERRSGSNGPAAKQEGVVSQIATASGGKDGFNVPADHGQGSATPSVWARCRDGLRALFSFQRGNP
jgi:hypothetical protein